jgi:uncharacterized protein YbjQ (UPF0145 family)
MIVVTTENLPGHRVRDVKGQCFGVVVRSRGARPPRRTNGRFRDAAQGLSMAGVGGFQTFAG